MSSKRRVTVAYAWDRLFLRTRGVGNVEGLAPFRQGGPRVPQAFIMFAFLGIVCFLGQSCALDGRFPCGLALGSHLAPPISTTSPPTGPILRSPQKSASWCVSLFLTEEQIDEPAGITWRR